MSSLLRGGIGSLIVRMSSYLIGLLMAVALARTLGADGYGTYAFILSVVTLLAMPVQAGLPTLVTRETARNHADQNWPMLRGLWRWSERVVLVMSGLVFAITLLMIQIFADGVPADYRVTFYFSLALVPLVALGNLRGAALYGLRRVVAGQVPQSILQPVILVFFLMAAYVLASRPLRPQEAMALHVIAAGGALLVGIVLLRASTPPALRTVQNAVYDRSSWTKAIIPLTLVSAVQLINNQADMLMLGLFSTAAEVGVYRVAASSVILMSFGLQAVNLVIGPHIARMYQQSDLERLQRLVTVSGWVTLLLALPVLFVFLLSGEFLLGWIFGEEFSTGYPALVILCLGHLVNVMMGSVALLLNMTGFEKETAKGVAIAALVNIALNLALIPRFGMQGAAIATSSSLVLWNILLWSAARRRTGISCGIFRR